MPADFERVPRRRLPQKDNSARGRTRRGHTSEQEHAPKRKAPSSREHAPQRKTASSRERVPQRKAASSREHVPQRKTASSREHVPQRKTASGREHVPERKTVSNRERVPQRKTASNRERVPERRRRERRPRTPQRKPIARRGQARRRAPRGGLRSLFTHVAILVLVLLAVGRLGDRLVFQELQVRHPDQISTEQALSVGDTLPPKKAVSDHITAAAPDRAAAQNRKEGFYTILMAGVDDHNGGSDTVILLSVDAKEHQLFGVSIPRDTKALVNGTPHKINAAYKNGGMALLAQTVTELMSIPVDYTVEVDLNGFAAVIDAIGGVDFDVPIDMDYEDPKQNLKIHVSKGFQHLDGETALKVVRFRHNSDGSGYGDEDLGRIRTQQAFLKAAAKQMASLTTLTKLDDMARIFKKYVKTDLNLPNLAWLGKEAFYAGADGIQFATLSGTWKSPYLYTDTEKALTLINEHLNPYQDDRTPDDLHFPK